MVSTNFLPRKMLQMAVAMYLATVIQGMKVEEIPEDPRTSPHVVPELTYHILNADHLFLRDTGDVSIGNLSQKLQKQAFIMTGLTGQPTMIVSYGPMSVEQTIPLDVLHTEPKVLAFLLARQVRSSSPVIRVLFYAPSKPEVVKDLLGQERPGRSENGYICITTRGFWEAEEVRGVCTVPASGGFCLANLTLEPAWFSPGRASWSSRERRGNSRGTGVELYYQTKASPTNQCLPQEDKEWRPHRLGERSGQGTESNMKKIGSVNLLRSPPGNSMFMRLRLGGSVIVQTSSKPLKTTETATFYVYLSSTSTVEHFILRVTAERGMSFSSARPSDSQLWDVVLDPGRGTDPQTISIICQRKSPSTGRRGLLEVLQLDFEAQEQGEQLENQIITWHLELPASMIRDKGTMRIYTVQREYVGIAPLTMTSELLNTAVLTGKNVSVPVTVLGVESDGSVTDITGLVRCGSSDEGVLKVSTKCDSLYMNGKETRGRVRMMVNFTYSYMSAQLEVSVWMPHLPLQVDIPDPELSQIKGWRVPIPGDKRASWQSEEADERQSRGCTLQYQRCRVRVFAAFGAESVRPDVPSPTRFPGSGWLVDVTRLVRYSLRVEDTSVARLLGGTVLSARAAGVTTVQVMSPLSDSVLAERVVRVLDDKVSITELGVQLVSGLSLNLQLSTGSSRAIVATTSTQDTMYNPKQEAVVACWVQFSDGSQAPLDLFDPSSYAITLSSLDKRVVSVRMVPGPAVVAEAEGQGLLLRAELAICDTCQKSKRKSMLAIGTGNVRVKFLSADQRGGVRGRTRAGARGLADRGTHAEPVDSESKVSLTSSHGLVEIPRNTITGMRKSTIREITITSNKSSLQQPVGAPASTVRAASNVSKTVTVAGTVGPANDQRKNHSDLTDNSHSPSREKKSKEDPPLVENTLTGPFVFFFTDLEFCIYSIVAVSCLAVIAFLLNCATHSARSHSKKVPEQCQGPDENRHHWVRLGTAAEQGRVVPIATTYKQQVPSAAEMPTGTEKQRLMDRPRGTELPRAKDRLAVSCDERPIALGRSATLPLRTTSIALRSSNALAEPVHSEPLHSPTSKRNQVQFTTFTTLDIQHLAALKRNGLEFNWTSRPANEATGASQAILANERNLCSHVGATNQRVCFQIEGHGHAGDCTEAKGYLPETPRLVVQRQGKPQ